MTSKDPFVRITKEGDKIIENNGFRLKTYKNIPKNLKFKHKAVNDYNQHLCGGWSVIKREKFEEINRVISGLKPVGVTYAKNFKEVEDKAFEVMSKGFQASYGEGKGFIANRYIITASVTGKLGDYFDMKTLAKDYENNGLSSENIKKYVDVDFINFHHRKYDCKDHPLEIVGLILGYPIENTISLMKYDGAGNESSDEESEEEKIEIA